MSNGNGKETEKKPSHIGVIKVGGEEFKVVNTATLLSIQIHKLENGAEVSQLVCHEFMMTEQKSYLTKRLVGAIRKVYRVIKPKYHRYVIKHVLDAIDAVADATKRDNKVILSSMNQLRRIKNRVRGQFGRKR